MPVNLNLEKSIERKMNTLPESEFSRVFSADDLSGKTVEIDIDATKEECRALAERFELEGVNSLTAHLNFAGGRSRKKLTLESAFSAEITQICVVTLEPFDSRIEGTFDCIFVPETLIDQEDEVEIYPDEEDPPEPIIDGKIDAGELVTEHLGLEIEPFPKSPGANFDARQGGDNNVLGSAERDNPFAKLEEFKNR